MSSDLFWFSIGETLPCVYPVRFFFAPFFVNIEETISTASVVYATRSRTEIEPEPLSSSVYEGFGFGAHNTYHGPTRHLRAPLNAITGSPVSIVLF